MELTKQEVSYIEKSKGAKDSNLDFEALREIGLSDEEIQILNTFHNIQQKIGTPAGSCEDILRYSLWSLEYLPKADQKTKRITKESYLGTDNFRRWFESAKGQCKNSADKPAIFVSLQKIADFCDRFEKENGICEEKSNETNSKNSIAVNNTENQESKVNDCEKKEVKTMNNENANKPVASFKEGGLGVSLWNNTGKNGDYFSVTLRKSYKDKQTGEWKTQQINILGVESVDSAISLLQQARKEME